MSANITSAELSFEVISEAMWPLPDWMDAEKGERKHEEAGRSRHNPWRSGGLPSHVPVLLWLFLRPSSLAEIPLFLDN